MGISVPRDSNTRHLRSRSPLLKEVGVSRTSNDIDCTIPRIPALLCLVQFFTSTACTAYISSPNAHPRLRPIGRNLGRLNGSSRPQVKQRICRLLKTIIDPVTKVLPCVKVHASMLLGFVFLNITRFGNPPKEGVPFCLLLSNHQRITTVKDKRWFRFSLYINVSRGELPRTSHRWSVHPHLIYLMNTLKRRIL